MNMDFDCLWKRKGNSIAILFYGVCRTHCIALCCQLLSTIVESWYGSFLVILVFRALYFVFESKNIKCKKMSRRKRTRKFLYFGVVPLINTFIHKHKLWMKSFIRMRHKGFGPRTNDV